MLNNNKYVGARWWGEEYSLKTSLFKEAESQKNNAPAKAEAR
ncbi:hypothetical protein RCJ22_14625 [Vibrio sp. FNV 38]|nr:hypothetical protein [Vibrio sp. FNV 38]